jgi:hypothetical protein
LDEEILSPDGRILRIFDARNGQPTLTVNEVLIHSKYDPDKEAVSFMDHNHGIYQDKDCVVAYGLGFGYHIRELLKRIASDCKVYLFEADNALLKKAKTLDTVQEVLKDHRVKLIEGYNQDFLNQFAEKLGRVGDLIIYKPSLRVLPNYYGNFKNAILDFEMGKIGLDRFGAILDKNDVLNQMLNHSPLDDFLKNYAFKSEPIVIASSGPSLDLCIKSLKKYRRHYKLFCAGSALRTLMKNQIEPDMICIIDAQAIVSKQFIGYENLSVPLCFLSSASHLALTNYKGPKYIFYNQPNQGSIIIETGKSVATALMSIALKGEANPIILIGQDLAYIDNKHHTEAFAEIYGESNEILTNGCYEKVLGVNGDVLLTNSGLMSFKRWIERTIEKNPGVIFFNASKGAKIIGTIEKDLDDIFK